MSKSYKFVLTLIVISLIACFTIGLIYLFYDKDVSESTIVVVEGNLSVNFLDGNVIKNKVDSEYNVRVSITNNSSSVSSYSVNLEDVKNDNNNVSISINNTTLNSVVGEFVFPKSDDTLVTDIQIGSGETHNYNIVIKESNNKEYSAVIKVKEEKPTIKTFAQTILDDNAVSNATLSTIGSEVASLDEGLISDIDDYGSTYYFRGDIKTNYVDFADQMWRIIRINGDGTVKLILNGTTDTVQSFYQNTEGEFYKFEESNIQSYLNSWYEFNLTSYDNYIAIDKYCNDYTTTNETDHIYNSYVRNITDKIPTFNCLGEKVGTKIGLITADEVIYAGGSYQTENTSYYLYNGDITDGWWTMTPATGTETSMNPFIVNATGSIDNTIAGSYNRSIRPVISLIKDISVTGAGTEENPYKLEITN